ncbi:MAG: hypothetical protein Tsb0034_19660 [Ekhidna sp.]
MKYILTTFLLLSVFLAGAQRFKTYKSHIRFFSDAPMEDIEAVNKQASSIVNVETMDVVMVIPITAFEFKKKLMQDHFNENYLESDKYPRAVFKGKLIGWDGSEKKAVARAKGSLEIHGVTQEVEIAGDLTFTNDELELASVFMIRLADYDIKIPKAVFYKIAEEVEVTATFNYKPYEKD